MQKRKTPGTKKPIERELSEQLANPERCKADDRKARADALLWHLEFRNMLKEEMAALERRINELLSVPTLRAVSESGQKPRVVPRNCRAAYATLTSLKRTYALLAKSALTPLPSELLMNAALEDSAEMVGEAERNDPAQKVAPDAAAGDPAQTNATKCDVLHQNSASREEKGVVIEPGGGGDCAAPEEVPPIKAS